MNEVEIVVTSSDRTNFAGIGPKARTQVNRAVSDSLRDVDKNVSAEFKKAGDHAGQVLSNGVRKSSKVVEKTVKESADKAGKSFAGALKDGIENADDVVTYKIREVSGHWQRTITHRLKVVGDEGGNVLYKSLGSSVSQVRQIGTHAGAKVADGLLASLKGGLSTPVLGPVLIAGLLAAVLAAGPVIGAALAGALVLSFGVGLAAMAMIFGARTKHIKSEASRLGKDIGKGWRSISDPFKVTWMEMLGTVRSVGRYFKPILKDAFKELGPGTSRLIRNLGQAFKELGPSVKPLSRAFVDLMDALGPQLPGIFEDMSLALTDIANTISDNPDLFADMIAGMLQLVPLCLQLVAALSDLYDNVSKFSGSNSGLTNFLWSLPGIIGQITFLLKGLKPFWEFFTSKRPTTPTMSGFGDIKAPKMPTMPAVRDQTAHINISVRGAGAARAAVAGVQAAVNRLRGKTVSIRQSGAGAARNAVASLAAAIARLRGKTVSIRQTGAKPSQNAAQQLINTIKRIHSKWFKIECRGAAAAVAAVRRVIGAISRVVGKTVNVIVNYIRRTIGGKATGGIVGGMESGGIASLARGIGHAAEGGARGAMTLVGEAGPELVELPFGSRVRSNPDTARLMAGAGAGGGQTIQIEWVGGNASDSFMRWLRENIRIKGGNVQNVLGS